MRCRSPFVLGVALIVSACAPQQPPQPAVPDGPTHPVVEAPQVVLSQVSYVFSDGRHPNSSWGNARISYALDAERDVSYLNLFINGAWLVQNVPVRGGKGEETTTHELVIAFNLGNAPGTVVDQLSFASLVLPDLYVGGTPEEEIYDLKEKTITIPSGQKGQKTTLKLPVEPTTWADDVKAQDKAFHKASTIVNQNCGFQECFGAAVSNSLKMLKAQNPDKFKQVEDKPNSDKDSIDIPHVLDETGFAKPSPNYNPYSDSMLDQVNAGGSPIGDGTTADPEAHWSRKKAWLDGDPKIPIETKFIDDKSKIADVLQAIKDGCDVELIASGHAVMVTGVVKLGNGNYVFEIADDVAQGQGPFTPDPNNPDHKGKIAHNGGTYSTLIKYDTSKNEFSGRGYIEGDKMTDPGKAPPLFVVECVQE